MLLNTSWSAWLRPLGVDHLAWSTWRSPLGWVLFVWLGLLGPILFSTWLGPSVSVLLDLVHLAWSPWLVHSTWSF